MKLWTFAPLAAATMLAFAPTSFAQTSEQSTAGPSFNSAGFSYLSVDVNGEDADGISFDATVSFADNWFVMANAWGIYREEEGTPYEHINVIADISLGYKFTVTDSTAIYGSAGLTTGVQELYYYGDVIEEDDDSGFNFGVGIRQKISDGFQIELDARQLDFWDDTFTQYTATGRIFLSKGFTVDVSYRKFDDLLDTVGVGIAWHW